MKPELSDAIKRVAAMTDAERSALSARMPAVITPDGHPLSIRNTILLYMQGLTSPTIVGGFRQWLKHGRCVAKGQHAAYILIPCGARKSDDDSDAKDRPAFFRDAAVFDISQTVALDAQSGAESAASDSVEPAPVAEPQPDPAPRRNPPRAPTAEYYSEQFTPM